MQKDCISEPEVEACVTRGEHEITQVVNGETRYGKKLVLKSKTIMVIYTIKNNEERVITAYVIKRKRIWGNENA